MEGKRVGGRGVLVWVGLGFQSSYKGAIVTESTPNVIATISFSKKQKRKK